MAVVKKVKLQEFNKKMRGFKMAFEGAFIFLTVNFFLYILTMHKI